jgi:hypothetical protein
MWIFTTIVLTAVGGTAFWLALPKLTAWVDAKSTPSTPVPISTLVEPTHSDHPRHRATDTDVEHHAATLIARLEGELRLAAERDRMDREIAMLDGMLDVNTKAQGMEAIAHWLNAETTPTGLTLVTATRESIDAIAHIDGDR